MPKFDMVKCNCCCPCGFAPANVCVVCNPHPLETPCTGYTQCVSCVLDDPGLQVSDSDCDAIVLPSTQLRAKRNEVRIFDWPIGATCDGHQFVYFGSQVQWACGTESFYEEIRGNIYGVECPSNAENCTINVHAWYIRESDECCAVWEDVILLGSV